MGYSIPCDTPYLINSKFIKIKIPGYYISDYKEIQFHLSRIPKWSSWMPNYGEHQYNVIMPGLHMMLDKLSLGNTYNDRHTYISKEFYSNGLSESELEISGYDIELNNKILVDTNILHEYLGYEIEAVGLPVGICFYILDENYNFIYINNNPDEGYIDTIFNDETQTEYRLWDLKSLNLPEIFYLRVFAQGNDYWSGTLTTMLIF